MGVVWLVGLVLPIVVLHVWSLLPRNTWSVNGAKSAEGQGVEGDEGDRAMVGGAEKEDGELKLPALSF